MRQPSKETRHRWTQRPAKRLHNAYHSVQHEGSPRLRPRFTPIFPCPLTRELPLPTGRCDLQQVGGHVLAVGAREAQGAEVGHGFGHRAVVQHAAGGRGVSGGGCREGVARNTQHVMQGHRPAPGLGTARGWGGGGYHVANG